MLTVRNVTNQGYFLSVNIPHMDEIIIVTIVLAIWVYSILQFFRQWSEWLIPAPSCEPFYSVTDTDSLKNYSSSVHVSWPNINFYESLRVRLLQRVLLFCQIGFCGLVLNIKKENVKTNMNKLYTRVK